MPDTAMELGIGLHPGVPMEAYLAHPAVNASGLEKIRRSPLQYRYAAEHPKESTDALERGTALHMALLEPDYFDGHYVVLGQCEGTKRNGDSCTYQASVHRHGAGYCGTHDPCKGEPPDPAIETLKQPDYDAVLGMRDAVLANPRTQTIFKGLGSLELTAVWEDLQTGVVCKIRPDRLVERAGMLCDVKTTRDAAEWAFPRDAERRGYFRKLGFYRRGLRALGWDYKSCVVIAVESEPPHDLITYIVDEASLDTADREITRLLRIYRNCQEQDEWPGYQTGDDGFTLLRRPLWAIQSDDVEVIHGAD